MKVAYCIAGLGFGDEGKGACCEYLCKTKQADLIVKYSGGCQAAHNVVNEAGKRFCFSQLGAGSDGIIPTYLWRNFIVDPIAMLNEAEGFQEWSGIKDDPLNNVYVHPDCPIVGPLEVSQNRNDENNLSHGTCGRGIGRCRENSRTCSVVFRARDTSEVRHSIDSDIDNYRDRLLEWASRVNITGEPPKFKTAIFEGSQGILLDESVGFHPHTTWSKVTFDVAHACYRHLGIKQYLNVGCTRAYHTRHGAGPLPTETDLGLTDEGNPENKYQGGMRFGHFDKVLFRYALRNAGDIVDLVALSHCDEAPQAVCTRYDGANELWKPSCIEDQVLLCQSLQYVKPILSAVDGEFWLGNLGTLYQAYGPRFSDRRVSRHEHSLRSVP